METEVGFCGLVGKRDGVLKSSIIFILPFYLYYMLGFFDPKLATDTPSGRGDPGLIFFLSHSVDRMTLDLSAADKTEFAKPMQGKI